MIDHIPMDCVMDGALKDADIICVMDRDNPEFHIQLWGQESTAHIVPYGGPPHECNCVDLQINSNDEIALQKALFMVERAKGFLPQDVQHLKRSTV